MTICPKTRTARAPRNPNIQQLNNGYNNYYPNTRAACALSNLNTQQLYNRYDSYANENCTWEYKQMQTATRTVAQRQKNIDST